MTREEIMIQWDYWRKQIANGDVSSAPRDWLESILDLYDELGRSTSATSGGEPHRIGTAELKKMD